MTWPVIADLVAGLFLRIECRANTDGVSTDTRSVDLRNVSATVDLFRAAAYSRRSAAECFQC